MARVRRCAAAALAATALLCIAGLGFAACTEEFTPYERLEGTRLLAVRADRPSIHQGETASLDALVYSGDSQPLTYRWSWCPVQGDPSNGFVCPITDAMWRDLMAASPAPFGPPSLDLGKQATAALPYPGDRALVTALCEAIRSQPHPPHMAMPSCTGSFTVFVRVEVSTPQDTFTAIKEVELLLDADAEPNTNPQLEGIAVALPATDGAPAPLDLRPNQINAVPVADDLTLTLRLDAQSIQSFTPAPTPSEPHPSARDERPIITWFVEAGELDVTRTGVVEGASSLEEALRNAWHLGASRGELSLVVVVRDGRGGVDWAQRTISLSE